jgi:hypothetical protein
MAEITLTQEDWRALKEINDAVKANDPAKAKTLADAFHSKLVVSGAPGSGGKVGGAECALCAVCGWSVLLLALAAFPVPVA